MAKRKRDSKGRFISKPSGPKKKKQPGVNTRFSSTNQPKTNGRKKKLTTVLKDYGYGPSEIRDWFRVISQMPLAEVEKLSNDMQQPAIVVAIAAAFIRAQKYGSYKAVSEILEQVIGRAAMKQEIDFTGLNIEVLNLTEKDYKKQNKK